MEFENTFTVPVPPAQAWDALMDMDKVASCMPGATLLENDGDRFVGKVKVKVGPITVSYKGSAEFVEKDQAAGRAVLQAKGREERGAGTAGMTVAATLEPSGDHSTQVRVLTDLDITGKPAQFGRGVMSEVGTAIIGQFATRLARQLTSEGPAARNDAPESAAPAGGSENAAPRSVLPPSSGAAAGADADAPLDLGMLVWAPAAKRLVPVVAGGLALLVLGQLLFRRPSTPSIVVVYGHPPMA